MTSTTVSQTVADRLAPPRPRAVRRRSRLHAHRDHLRNPAPTDRRYRRSAHGSNHPSIRRHGRVSRH